jgi:hypothetical protein
MRSHVAALGVVVATLLVAAPILVRAQALAERDAPAPRPNTIRLDAGIGSAVGFLGITLTRTLESSLEIEAGVGTGFSGTQLSLMPKIVLGGREVHFVSGVGVSIASPTNSLHSTGHPIWLNVDAVGIELVSSYGLTFLASAGITRGLGGGGICTSIDGCEPEEKLSSVAGVWSPQLRAGWGYTF